MHLILLSLSATLILAVSTGCSRQGGEPGGPDVMAVTTPASAETALAVDGVGDDGLARPAGDLSVLGDFALWEDREGGLVCPVELESARMIGGHSIVFDEECVSRLKLGGDLYAWFAAEDSSIVLIDATRRVLVRLKRLPNDDYYAEREAGLENLNLTRPN